MPLNGQINGQNDTNHIFSYRGFSLFKNTWGSSTVQLILSMTYLFERNKDNCHLKIRAEFKGNPKIFKVSLEGFSKKASDAEGYVVMELTEEQNYEYRSTFWNAAKKIYNELKKL